MHRKRLTKPLTMREPIFRNMSSYSGLEKPLSITDASVMSDETWRGIIIRSIPRTARWLPVIPSLCAMSSSADIISTLFAHGMIIGRNTKASSNSSNTVLVAQTTTEGCTNQTVKLRSALPIQQLIVIGLEVERKVNFRRIVVRETERMPLPLGQLIVNPSTSYSQQ